MPNKKSNKKIKNKSSKTNKKIKLKILPPKFLNFRGYVLLKNQHPPEELENLRKELTVKPHIPSDYGLPPKPFPIYMESETKFYIPEMYGIKKYGLPSLDKTYDGKIIDLKFNGQLRDNQIEPVNDCIKALNNPKKRGGLLCLGCSQGKTVCLLYIIAHIKRLPLIIVNKEFLVNQWKERIEQFLPDARIGMIQGKRVETKNKDIVIGMLQSLSMKDYDPKIFKKFGMVIYDECHQVPCRVFSRVLKKINCKRHIGLSATPNRTDGMIKVFKWYIGDIIYKRADKPNSDKVIVKRYVYDCDDQKYCKEILNYRDKPQMSTMINNIAYYEPLNIILAKKCIEIAQESPDRKLLFLSDRLKQLRMVDELIKSMSAPTSTSTPIITAYYIGGMKQKELKKSESAQIIFGTYAMASTGLDIPGLNAEILATPKSNIIQSVGRIIRKKHEILSPIVIDIVHSFSVFENQARKRLKFYISKKYDIYTYEINQSGNILKESINLEEDRQEKKRQRKQERKQQKKQKSIQECLFTL